ncbi:hypothetical protein [Planktothrix pseudagardhii]|uniref:Uncharacterized protein n=1 Tax=Planktothrix pseudagardhii TaxID=132604 RepID=A0A9W4G2J2_9CYAN|nr:hypothetical protein [Planktothrix pseudagardhii]CAD5917770.1 hypothetical protein NO713_00460 [Planktothrix pseudagardhii]
MKLPSFSRDSWLIAIAMGGLCLFALPNSPAPATSASASPSSQPSSPPTSPPLPESPLLDELQSNLPMLNSKLDAAIKALGSVKTELTPEQLKSAWTNVDAQVDQLCTQTVSPLKKRIEEESKKDTTYKTIADLFNQIGTTCNNINNKTDQLKANSQQSSDPQETVDSPETNIKQELQSIKQLLNQVKEWVNQEQEKKYRESLEKRLDFQKNLQYSILGLLFVLLLGLFIRVILDNGGDRTVDGADQDKSGDGTKKNPTFVGLKESEALRKILEYFDEFLKKQTEALSNVETKLPRTLLEEVQKLISQKIDENNDQIKKSFQENLEHNFHILWESIKKQIEEISINTGNSQQEYSHEDIKKISEQLANIPDLIKDQNKDKVDRFFSDMEKKLIPLIKKLIREEYNNQQLTIIADHHEAVATGEDDQSSSEELNNHNEQIQVLQSQLEKITKEVEQLKSENSQSKENIKQLQTTLQAEQETIHQLQSDLEEKQNTLDSLEQQITIKDSTINSLQSEITNKKQKNEAEKTTSQQNKTPKISQKLQSLVDKYNQNNGDFNVLKSNSPIPVKDDSDAAKGVIKVNKVNESDAKFYVISYSQELYLFPKLIIDSNIHIKGLVRYFKCTLTDSTTNIQLVTPAKMKQISEEDSWELVDENSKGQVK